ncbi:tyrosine-type recombinase/integrase [Leifsonia sp. TF02-11]|uniref:tyrosine-type recombinase/integrase n=1 Tax=Leifsonia sp. TF02-11 TaxID=2815212 RepID=UPI001AA1A959|nr:tyrosine-type recombinase/integrase [Leifsonia sp. TF02-11]MBO1741587.1 tyrosine-type recombinase/integrase [Leifsonia sp. TF02-11]
MSEPDTPKDPVGLGLRTGDVPLARVGSVRAGPGPMEPYLLLDEEGRVVESVSAWVRYMVVGDHSPRTIRSYCYAALTWFRVLWQLDVGWERATEAETAALVGWLRVAPNTQRRRQAGAPAVNLKTGKPNLGLGYSAATINLTLAAVRGFYDFHAHWARGPVVNPVPESPARRRALAHRSPLEPRQAYRRGAYRQRAHSRAPRSIPDAMWDEFFAQMPSDRDRALVACYVSSGARAEELLGAQIEDVDWAGQRMSVVSKGSRERRLVPLSPEAMTWLSRYLRIFDDASSGPLWRTIRGEPRPLTYSAARRVLQRANGRLGTNWTLHDLRHTAAMRMVSSGVLTLPEVQVVLGHADLRTTSIYTTPRIEEVIDKVHEHYARPAPPRPRFASGYAAEDIAIIFGDAGE